MSYVNMYIKDIHINEFRHLKNVHLGPFTQPTEQSDIIVLAGPNGGGKSSILELIGFALTNTWNLNWVLRRSFGTYSFEVAITLSPDEQNLVREFTEKSEVKFATNVLEYFKSSGTYYRAYNYQNGEYQKNPSLHDDIHKMVTAALRDHYKRSLGFFIKPDRSYTPRTFDRNRIFSHEQYVDPNYVWNMGFNTSEMQYGDIYDILIQEQYHYIHMLGLYQLKRDKGDTSIEKPINPLEKYNRVLESLFPGYCFPDPEQSVPTNLFVMLPSGDKIHFSDLSSGEQEAFFMLSFFLRHNVNNAIIAIDEPELHLHPELARQLIRTMLSIRPRNQVWLATHNSEIIDEAGRDKVIYVSRDPKTRATAIILGTDESESTLALKQFYGYSGYIGIARKLVFLEGIDSSSDRKMFTRLFPLYGNQIKFIPSKSSDDLARINTAVLSMLADNLGWISYYLIRDRDYLTDVAITKLRKDTSGKMYVLKRYHIENYLIDYEIIALVQDEIFNKKTTVDVIQKRLTEVARNMSAEFVRDMIEFRLNLVYGPQDFSLGKFMENEAIINKKGEIINDNIVHFKKHLLLKVNEINSTLSETTNDAALQGIIEAVLKEVQEAFSNNADGWKILFPGRRILEQYAKENELGKKPAFINSLIKELASHPNKIPEELSDVMQKISENKILEVE